MPWMAGTASGASILTRRRTGRCAKKAGRREPAGKSSVSGITTATRASFSWRKKCKRGGLGWKEQTQLTERQARDIAAGRFHAVRSRRGCAARRAVPQRRGRSRLRAKTIVDYTREPFVYGPGNVRVTLDEDIRTGLSCVDFLDPDWVSRFPRRCGFSVSWII